MAVTKAPAFGCYRTTGSSGSLDYQFYPSTGATVDISASAVLNGPTLVGELNDLAVDSSQTYVVTLPGALQ